jgi:APA family basic amino acid/polyamine antiporter
MVGTGILTNSGPIIDSNGSHLICLSLWAVGGVLALCGALTLAEMATAMPHAGGDYIYVNRAYGPAVGFTYGLAMSVLGFAAPCALVSFTTASYLLGFISDSVPSPMAIKLMSTGAMLIFTLAHCLGQKSSARVQTFSTLFYVLVLFSLVVGALFSPLSSFSHLLATRTDIPFSLSRLGNGLILVMYAYTGWNAAVYLAGEIKEPQKKLPISLLWGTALVTLFYLALNFAYGFAITPKGISELPKDQAGQLAYTVANVFWGAKGSKIFSLLLSCGVLASLSALILTGPRIVYAMALDGLFPAYFSKVSRLGVPSRAIVFQSICAIALIWSGTFLEVLNFTGYGLAVVGILVVTPIFALRRLPHYQPTFKVPYYPWLPLIFIVVSVAGLVTGFWQDPKVSFLSFLSVLSGFPLYWVWRRL